MKPDAPHAVYRIFNKSDELLYVGISFSPSVRLSHHKGILQAWRDVAKIELVWYDNRALALAAEAEIIAAEQPPWNTMGTERSGPAGKGRALKEWLIEATGPGGMYGPGDKLPSIAELAEQHGMSMTTASLTVALLCDSGRLQGHQGVGIFVPRRPPGLS